MTLNRSLAVACLAALVTPLVLTPRLHASTDDKTAPLNLTVPAAAISSSGSAELPDAPSAEGRVDAGYAMGKTPGGQVGVRPFSALGVAVKFGSGGVGFDLATPLASRLNLRAGATFFSYSPSITVDNIAVNGTLTLKTVGASLDIFPFGNTFRVSPGLTMYNGNHLSANAVVAGGQTFTLGDATYTSNPTNPVGGTFDMAFGNKVAPSFTIGTGNMIPHKSGQHWSVPFEIGFEYIGTPLITLNLTGSACDVQYGCQPVATTPQIQANVAQEQTNLNNDISALKVYPILSVGVSYKFGR